MALSFIPFRFPGVEAVRCAFQTRSCPLHSSLNDDTVSLEAGGDPVRATANRQALVRELGLAELAEMRQVHGTRTVFEPAAQPVDQAPTNEADGMATSRPGLGLMIKTADCQPVLLAHKSGRHVAALHVGWRGNLQNYPGLGVAEFCRRYQAGPGDLYAVRGPSLSPAVAEFTNFEREWGSEFRPWFNPDDQTMDLWRLTRDQLLKAGLKPEKIYSLDLCTLSMPDSFFSYRLSRKTGRQASVIWIEQPS